MIPVYGFVAGDTLGVVVMVHDHETVADLALRLQQAAAVRVAPRPRVRVVVHGLVLDRDSTVKAAGLTALDRVDVIPEDT